MHEPFVWLTAFSFDTAHLKIRRCRWAWCPLRISVAVCIHDAEIMLRMLVEVFRRDAIAASLRLPRQRDITLEDLIRVAANFHTRPIAVERLRALRQTGPVVMRTTTTTTASIATA